MSINMTKVTNVKFEISVGTTVKVPMTISVFSRFITKRGNDGVAFEVNWMGMRTKWSAYLNAGVVSEVSQWDQRRPDPQIAYLVFMEIRRMIAEVGIDNIPTIEK